MGHVVYILSQQPLYGSVSLVGKTLVSWPGSQREKVVVLLTVTPSDPLGDCALLPPEGLGSAGFTRDHSKSLIKHSARAVAWLLWAPCAETDKKEETESPFSYI